MLKLFRVGVSGTGLVAHPTNAYPKQFEHLNYNILYVLSLEKFFYVYRSSRRQASTETWINKLHIPLRVLAGGIVDAAVC